MTQIKWDEVLAVYVVKTVTDSNNPTEVVTVDDSKKEILRTVLWDMIKISSFVKTEERELPVVSINESGNEVTTIETVNVKVLIILVSQKECSEIAFEYGFNVKQKEQLDELLSNEFCFVWKRCLRIR